MSNHQNDKGSSHDNDNDEGSHTFLVRASARFIVLTLLSSTLVAFAVGQVSSVLLDLHFRNEFEKVFGGDHPNQDNDDYDERIFSSGEVLPNPVLEDERKVAGPPKTLYTLKSVDTTRSDVNSHWIVTKEGEEQEECRLADQGSSREGACRRSDLSAPNGSSRDDDDDDGDEGEEENHVPKGRHLLMDIENVDGDFLNSDERLAKAMFELVDECGLTLLSYNCHGLVPIGVNCAGALLEGHVTFHTWPAEGVITFDLFTWGGDESSSLLPVVPLVERLFGVASEVLDRRKPHVIWAHKFRGFPDDKKNGESEASDFYKFPIGEMLDMKQKILSAQTDFQRVDVYDVLIPNTQSFEAYQRSLTDAGSYEATHPEFFQPDRIVFLDGVMQSRRSGDAAYHEALVHPAMFAHANPKRVAIIGGGEGATLREVLKHNTVEKVVMIEIDGQMVNLSREFLPEWSDCSMLEGSSDNCFDDPRVELYCEDAFGWFIDKFNGRGDEDRFDVIIMDALDPQIQIPFVEALYDGGPFLRSLPVALGDSGMLIAQVGEAPDLSSPPEALTLDKNRANFFRSLADLGFESVREYDEAGGGFFFPWQFVVAFKSLESERVWLDAEQTIAYKMRRRLLPTQEGRSPLRFFDGATMASYYYPSKPSAVVFCRGNPDVVHCNLEAKPSRPDEHPGNVVSGAYNPTAARQEAVAASRLKQFD